MRHLPLSELLVQRRSRLPRLAFSVLIQEHTKTHALKEAELLADTDLLHRSFSVLIQGHKNMSYIIHRHAPKEAAQPASSSASYSHRSLPMLTYAYVCLRPYAYVCLRMLTSAACRSELPRTATAACLPARRLPRRQRSQLAALPRLGTAYELPRIATAACLPALRLPRQPTYQLLGCLV